MATSSTLLLYLYTIKNIFKITQLGSNWNNGSNAGSFYWNLNNSVGNRNRNISSHLVNAWLISGSPKGLSVFIKKIVEIT